MHAHTDTLLKVGRVGLGVSEIAQWVEVLATKPEELSSTPRTHTVKETYSHKLSSILYICLQPKTNEQRNKRFLFLELMMKLNWKYVWHAPVSK